MTFPTILDPISHDRLENWAIRAGRPDASYEYWPHADFTGFRHLVSREFAT